MLLLWDAIVCVSLISIDSEFPLRILWPDKQPIGTGVYLCQWLHPPRCETMQWRLNLSPSRNISFLRLSKRVMASSSQSMVIHFLLGESPKYIHFRHIRKFIDEFSYLDLLHLIWLVPWRFVESQLVIYIVVLYQFGLMPGTHMHIFVNIPMWILNRHHLRRDACVFAYVYIIPLEYKSDIWE